MDISATTIGVTRGSITKTTPIELTFTSTEATNNFAETDISVTNGTLSGLVLINIHASMYRTIWVRTFECI